MTPWGGASAPGDELVAQAADSEQELGLGRLWLDAGAQAAHQVFDLVIIDALVIFRPHSPADLVLGADLAGALIEGGHLDQSFFVDKLEEPLEGFARALEFGRYGGLADVFRDWSPERAYLLERACDNALIEEVEAAKRQAYGIEPLVAFILTRQLEIKLVRTAVTARLDGVGRDRVEERLRSSHV